MLKQNILAILIYPSGCKFGPRMPARSKSRSLHSSRSVRTEEKNYHSNDSKSHDKRASSEVYHTDKHIRRRFHVRMRRNFDFVYKKSPFNPAVAKAEALKLVDHGDVDGALLIFRDRLPKQQYYPDVFDWTALMNHVGLKVGAFEAFRVFEAMSFVGIFPDEICFSALVKIFCDSDMLEEAAALIRRVPDEFGLAPTEEVFRPLLRYFSDKKVYQKVEQIFRLMETVYNITPSIEARATLASAYLNSAMPEKALDIIESVNKEDPNVSKKLSHVALKAVFVHGGNLEQVQRAWAIIKNRPEGPNIHDFNVIMETYEYLDLNVEVIDAFFEMIKAGAKDKINTPVRYALRAAMKLGNFDIVERIWSEFYRLNWHLKPDPVTYAMRARLAAMAGDVPGFITILDVAIPATLSESYHSLALRGFYGCLTIFGAISESEYNAFKRELISLQGGPNLPAPASVAIQTKNKIMSILDQRLRKRRENIARKPKTDGLESPGAPGASATRPDEPNTLNRNTNSESVTPIAQKQRHSATTGSTEHHKSQRHEDDEYL